MMPVAIEWRACGAVLATALLMVLPGCGSRGEAGAEKSADPTPTYAEPDWPFAEAICDRLNERPAVTALLNGLALRLEGDRATVGVVRCLPRAGASNSTLPVPELLVHIDDVEVYTTPEDAMREGREKLREKGYRSQGECVSGIECWLLGYPPPVIAYAYSFPYWVEVRLSGLSGEEEVRKRTEEGAVVVLKETLTLLRR